MSLLSRIAESVGETLQVRVVEESLQLTQQPASLVGDTRWDALIAAVVEDESTRMDRSEIVSALEELSEVLNDRGVNARIYVVGGAAMSLAFSSRYSTEDVDVDAYPTEDVISVAREIAPRSPFLEGSLELGELTTPPWSHRRSCGRPRPSTVRRARSSRPGRRTRTPARPMSWRPRTH